MLHRGEMSISYEVNKDTEVMKQSYVTMNFTESPA